MYDLLKARHTILMKEQHIFEEPVMCVYCDVKAARALTISCRCKTFRVLLGLGLLGALGMPLRDQVVELSRERFVL